MGAMREEIASLLPHVQDRRTRTAGRREYIEGTLWGNPVVLVESRWGKVAAAATAARLIADYSIRELLFTGVAGAIDPSLRIGDVVIAQRLIQHDLDASPIFPPMQIPLLGIDAIPADSAIADRLFRAAELFVKHDLPDCVSVDTARAFNLSTPRVLAADIATGDQFISTEAALAGLRTRVPSAACVEMEGAAVAQICFEHQVPFGIVRTISDTANHAAPIDFPHFLSRVAGAYAEGILRRSFALNG